MSARPLSSFPLPHSTLSALTRAGYDTTHDISSCTPEKLAEGPIKPIAACFDSPISILDLNIPLPASQAIFALSQKPRINETSNALPLTQSAASMVVVAKKFSTCCPPVDKLLCGGLARGQILEISGPPGTQKEHLAVNIVKSFIEAGEEVVFVGVFSSDVWSGGYTFILSLKTRRI
jgi:RAD51-like protein 2